MSRVRPIIKQYIIINDQVLSTKPMGYAALSRYCLAFTRRPRLSVENERHGVKIGVYTPLLG